jgi:ABC-type dipeptide/oligopeptide/nickel transport system permease component
MIPLVIYTATLFIIANLLVDLLYAAIDPRIRYD